MFGSAPTHQGNVCYIVDKYGNLVVSYNYDAWGNIVSKYFFKYGEANAKTSYSITLGSSTYTAENIDALNSFYYRSYYLDKETNFYYLTTRYYDPEVCRFISPDDPKYLDFEVADGHNRYAYCCNNPVMFTDPTGKAWWVVIIILAAVAIALAGSTVAYGAITGDTMMLDLSLTIPIGSLIFKFGVTVAFDFDDGIFEVYGHGGVGLGYSDGLSFTAGKVYGYEKRGDLTGTTFDISGGYYGGVDASSNLDDSNPISTFGLTVGYKGSFYWGVDEYFQWY